YAYTVDNALTQSLGATQTHIDTFTVTSVDGTTQDVSFTIQGVNDAAVIGAPSVAEVTEDLTVVAGNLTASGTISISDADANQGAFQTPAVALSGALGTLSLAANGDYTYAVANSA